MFTDPAQNVMHLALRPQMAAADFGAGIGAYSLALAKLVRAEDGKVYAVDVQKDLLARLKDEAAAKGLSNITPVWGDIEKLGGTTLGNAAIDAVIISNVLFQAETKAGVAAEASRVLKPGGQVLVVDWADSFGGLGPTASSVVSEGQAKEIFAAAGFTLKESFRAGEHHYGLVFTKT